MSAFWTEDVGRGPPFPVIGGLSDRGFAMSEFIEALECIGCGKLEGPRPCIGICQDRIVELAYAQEYKDALAQARRAEQQAKGLEALVKQLAWTKPRGGEWERSYRNLQEQARRILSSLSSHPPVGDGVARLPGEGERVGRGSDQ